MARGSLGLEKGQIHHEHFVQINTCLFKQEQNHSIWTSWSKHIILTVEHYLINKWNRHWCGDEVLMAKRCWFKDNSVLYWSDWDNPSLFSDASEEYPTGRTDPEHTGGVMSKEELEDGRLAYSVQLATTIRGGKVNSLVRLGPVWHIVLLNYTEYRKRGIKVLNSASILQPNTNGECSINRNPKLLYSGNAGTACSPCFSSTQSHKYGFSRPRNARKQ